MEDKVSVIIPVYNVEKYLYKCVDSVIAQTYSNLEIILVDDGSTDSSGNICDDYKDNDYRIIVIHKKNGGLSDARNAALDICTGDYISFVDSDDYISPYFIEIFLKVLKAGDCDIVAVRGGTDFWDGEEEPKLCDNTDDYTVEYLSAKDVLERMLYQHIATGAPFKFCKRDVYQNIRFPFGYLYEDVATTYKCFINAGKSAIIYSDIYAYRKRRNSIIRQKFSEKKLVALIIFDQLIEDENLINLGLLDAAKCRVYSMLYSVFLQVEENDSIYKKEIWNKLTTVQDSIRHNKSHLMRKKAKYAAWISLLGMGISYRIGRKLGQKGTMN